MNKQKMGDLKGLQWNDESNYDYNQTFTNEVNFGIK